MTANILSPHVRMLCIKAQNDESALRGDLTDDIFGFHAQQSCEKLLKALISSHGTQYPRTHSLTRLMELLYEIQETLPHMSYDLKLLDPYAVEFRYDAEIKLTVTDKQAIRETVAILREHILARIVELELSTGRSATPRK